MRSFLVACALAVVLPGNTLAELGQLPDFSGRWTLVASAPAQSSEPNTFEVISPDELLVTQTPRAIIVEHPSKPGTHPAAGTFEFGMGGKVGGIPGGLAASEGRWGVSFVGSQLIISDSTTFRDAAGRATTKATGAIWVLDDEGRLVIEFGERQTGQDPKNATLVYIRSSH